MELDIVIVGGSFAGQAAALQLARARRKVLLVDGSQPRNRFAKTAHGILGHDGLPPSDILAASARQLAAYPTLEFLQTLATEVEPVTGGFRIQLATGRCVHARRLILATGVVDTLPEVPGLHERWGVSVLHCPYCHGFELNEGPIGVLASGDMAFHQAMLVRDWGPTTLFLQGCFEPSPAQAQALLARGVTIERIPIVRLLGQGTTLEFAVLGDGRQVPLCGLFVAPRTRPAGELAAKIGCTLKDGPSGPYIAVDEQHRTSVPGVFAAGDAAAAMANATLAAAAGVVAASAAHHSLIFTTSSGEQK